MKKVLIFLLFVSFSSHLNSGNGFSCSRVAVVEASESSPLSEVVESSESPTSSEDYVEDLKRGFSSLDDCLRKKIIMQGLYQEETFKEAFEAFSPYLEFLSSEQKKSIVEDLFTFFYYKKSAINCEDLRILHFYDVNNSNVLWKALCLAKLKYTDFVLKLFGPEPLSFFNELRLAYKTFIYERRYFFKLCTYENKRLQAWQRSKEIRAEENKLKIFIKKEDRFMR